MRIALIDPSLFTWPYDLALARALRAAGHEVAIFGRPLDADAGPADAMLEPHFYRELIAVKQRWPRPLFLVRKALSHLIAMRRLLPRLREWQPDAIHVQWAPLPIVDRHFIPALRAIAPTLLTVHDSNPFNGNPRGWFQGLGAVSILSRFDGLIVHTRAARERLQSYGIPAERVHCIPHGALAAVDAPTPSSRKNLGTDPVRILLFGRIKPYKGADVLLDAAARMAPELLRRCRIHIIGEPFMDLRPLARQACAANIEQFVEIEPRFVAHSELGSLLESADIIVLPYREIDASGVLMLALAAGVPIVATRIGLFAELLEDGRHGRLIEVDDAAALGRALEQLVLEPDMRAQMAHEVCLLQRSLPSWASIAAMTERLYRELAPQPRLRRLAWH
jgi:glycosyltransferase involved in cell wall biosynthesis